MLTLDPKRYEIIIHVDPAFVDRRGAIVNVLQSDDALLPEECRISHVAVIDCIEGAIRANHYHPPGNVQFMYLISGAYRSLSVPLNEAGLPVGEVVEQRHRAGDLSRVEGMIGHAYEFTEPSVFVNINTQSRHADGFGQHTLPLPVALLP